MTGDLSKLTASGCQATASAQANKMLGKGFAKGGDVKAPVKRALGGAGKLRKGQAIAPKKGK